MDEVGVIKRGDKKAQGKVKSYAFAYSDLVKHLKDRNINKNLGSITAEDISSMSVPIREGSQGADLKYINLDESKYQKVAGKKGDIGTDVVVSKPLLKNITNLRKKNIKKKKIKKMVIFPRILI